MFLVCKINRHYSWKNYEVVLASSWGTPTSQICLSVYTHGEFHQNWFISGKVPVQKLARETRFYNLGKKSGWIIGGMADFNPSA